MEHTEKTLEQKESSAVWASDKGSRTEAPHGAAGQSPVEQKADETPLIGGEHLPSAEHAQVSLEGLTEKVGTLSLRATRRNCCGAAKKRARRARLAEAPTGDSSGGPPGLASGDKSQDLQKPGTSGAQHGYGSALAAPKSPKGRGHQQEATVCWRHS
jgi:hypothetical protein